MNAKAIKLLHQALGELRMLQDNWRPPNVGTTIQPYVDYCVVDVEMAIKELEDANVEHQ